MLADVRGHNDGTIYYRADRRAKVAAVMMRGQRRETEMCPHRNHGPNDPDCRESVAALAALLRRRDHRRQDPRKIRLGPYLQQWVSSLSGLAPATVRQHEMIIRVHLVDALGGFTLAELGPADVDRYLSRVDLDPQTRRHHRATLRRALQDAVREGIVDRNVAALAHAPTLPHRERQVLDVAQVRNLLEATVGSRWHALFALGATAGLRLSECLGLTWGNVDLDAGELHVRHALTKMADGRLRRKAPKSAKSRRSVALLPVAVRALRAHKAIQDTDRGDRPKPIDAYVFTTPTGQPIHGSNVLPHLYRALADASLPRVTFHDLRHSAATMLYVAGVPLPVISDMLGHSTIRITADLYRHRVPELSRDAADRLQAALDGVSGYQTATDEAPHPAGLGKPGRIRA